MIKKLVYKKIIFNNIQINDFENILEKDGLFTFPAGPTLANLKYGSTYHQALINSNLVFFDSGYFVLLLRFLKKIKVIKFSGYKFLKLLLIYLKKNNDKKIFLVNPNSKSSKINETYLRKIGVRNIKSYESPMYNPNSIEDYDLLKLISKNQPDYVIINLGGGVQEVLGYFLKKKITPNIKIFCTGGAISYFTGEQAPINKFIDEYYLGWLYRIIFNPKVFLSRYIKSFKLLKDIYNEDIKIF